MGKDEKENALHELDGLVIGLNPNSGKLQVLSDLNKKMSNESDLSEQSQSKNAEAISNIMEQLMPILPNSVKQKVINDAFHKMCSKIMHLMDNIKLSTFNQASTFGVNPKDQSKAHEAYKVAIGMSYLAFKEDQEHAIVLVESHFGLKEPDFVRDEEGKIRYFTDPDEISKAVEELENVTMIIDKKPE